METCDVAIIGGGPGGEAAARRAQMRGAKTCLIERNALGGSCLNVGCIPTKAMLYASDLFHRVQTAQQFGIRIESSALDGQAYMKRVHDVVASLVKSLDREYATGGVNLIRGRGRLTGADTIQIDLKEGGRREIQAGSIIIATGSAAAKPPALPWGSPNVWTTDQAVTAQQLPESILIIGGGVIGCEFATLYSELGIPTTVDFHKEIREHPDFIAGRYDNGFLETTFRRKAPNSDEKKSAVTIKRPPEETTGEKSVDALDEVASDISDNS